MKECDRCHLLIDSCFGTSSIGTGRDPDHHRSFKPGPGSNYFGFSIVLQETPKIDFICDECIDHYELKEVKLDKFNPLILSVDLKMIQEPEVDNLLDVLERVQVYVLTRKSQILARKDMLRDLD